MNANINKNRYSMLQAIKEGNAIKVLMLLWTKGVNTDDNRKLIIENTMNSGNMKIVSFMCGLEHATKAPKDKQMKNVSNVIALASKCDDAINVLLLLLTENANTFHNHGVAMVNSDI